MDGEYRQRINIELTESEADRLLNLVLSKEKTVQDKPELDKSSIAAMLFARLVGVYPNLIENDSAVSFLEQYGYGHSSGNDNDYEGVPDDKALVIWDRVSLMKVEQHLQATRNYIKAELAKLNAREKFIESCCIKRIFKENEWYPTDRRRLAEIWRRLGTDLDYKLVRERKQKLKNELAKISAEIVTLSRTTQADPVKNDYW